jgi:hypothetical protein
MSDIQDDILYADDTDFDSTGRPVAVRPGYISYGRPSWFLQQGASANFIRKYSYLYAFLYPIANRLKPEPPPGIRTLKGRIMHTEDSLAGRWQEYFSRTESYIRLIARLLQAKEIPFLLVVYPWGHQVSASEWVEGRKLFGLKPKTYNSAIFGSLELFAHETSISFLNMTPAFRRRSNGSLYFSIDEHWTNEGHRVAAETLARFLIETDLIHHEDDPEQKR